MEINWKMLKAGLLFGAIMGLLQFLNAITAFQTPPDWWTMFRLAIVPALGILLTTILQYCPKGPPKADNVLKCIVVVFMCTFLLAGCAAGPKLIEFDQKNYEQNKVLAKETLKTWSFNSGFISCAGLADKMKFPITTAAEARAILQNSQITLGIAELDELAKKRQVWSDEDYDYGCSLGIKARTGALATIDILKLFPTLTPYVTGLFP